MAEVVRMPRMSDTMTEGVIIAWHKKVGDQIKSGDLLAEIETDKAVMEFESFQDGVLLFIGAEKGAAVPVDSIIAVLGKAGEDYQALLTTASAPQPKETVQQVQNVSAQPVAGTRTGVANKSSNGKIKASPLAKKIAVESGVNISTLSGSGDEGRIVKRDVEAALQSSSSFPKLSEITPSENHITNQESYDEVAVSQMRKTIARRLSESKNNAPHFYLRITVNMDEAVASRKKVLEAGEKFSFNDLIIKASAMALRKHPKVNSSWLGDKIRYNHHIHIGMAVAVEDGLLVPVIRFADQKQLSQISTEAKIFGQKAKDKKLQPSDWEGNTFTISNLGMMDIDEFTAIINTPDACILAVGKINQEPAVVQGEIKIANVLKLTLSCDHRVVDGATGAAFLKTLKQYLENPMMMLV